MPSLRALSARFSLMPEPGTSRTPIGRASSIWSLRLNGAAFLCRAQSGLKATCGTRRLSAQQAAMRSAPLGEPPCIRTMAGCFSRTWSRAAQIRAWSLYSIPPAKAMRGPGGRRASVATTAALEGDLGLGIGGRLAKQGSRTHSLYQAPEGVTRLGLVGLRQV